jgi:hypothetical protein
MQDATKASGGASEDSAPPSKVRRTADAPEPAPSLAEMAMQAGAMAAAGSSQPGNSQTQPPAAQSPTIPDSPAGNQDDALQSPKAPAITVRPLSLDPAARTVSACSTCTHSGPNLVFNT